MHDGRARGVTGVAFDAVGGGGGCAWVVVNEVDAVDGAADGGDREEVEMVMDGLGVLELLSLDEMALAV